MKSTSGWNEYNGKSGNGTNTSGFAGLPGGYRLTNGTYGGVGDIGFWWSSYEYSTDFAWARNMGYDFGEVDRDDANHKQNGFSVRCLRDF
jgi:uncharacterized protein (TIGR02145 family)